MPDRHRHAGRTALLLLAALLATAGCGTGTGTGTPGPEASVTKESTVSVEPVTTTLECGRPFRLPRAGSLTLTGRFPATAAAGERAVAGTVEVTIRAAGEVAVRAVGAPRADVFLVRDGRVATMPMAQDAMGVRWDLTPGKVERLPGEATLVSCDPAGGRVRAGTYELYARVVITPDSGAAVQAFGGPWPLEVR
jgi:hypothetical protein